MTTVQTQTVKPATANGTTKKTRTKRPVTVLGAATAIAKTFKGLTPEQREKCLALANAMLAAEA